MDGTSVKYWFDATNFNLFQMNILIIFTLDSKNKALSRISTSTHTQKENFLLHSFRSLILPIVSSPISCILYFCHSYLFDFLLFFLSCQISCIFYFRQISQSLIFFIKRHFVSWFKKIPSRSQDVNFYFFQFTKQKVMNCFL